MKNGPSCQKQGYGSRFVFGRYIFHILNWLSVVLTNFLNVFPVQVNVRLAFKALWLIYLPTYLPMYLPNWLINSLGMGPSNKYFPTKSRNSSLLLIPSIHYNVRKRLPLAFVHTQTNPIHTPSYFRKINFNSVIRSKCRASRISYPVPMLA